jgi:hypothetical protein
MTSKEKLTQAVGRRKAALKKLTAGGKSTPQALRRTRKQLKRAQRTLAKLASRTAKAAPKAAEEKKEEVTG